MIQPPHGSLPLPTPAFSEDTAYAADNYPHLPPASLLLTLSAILAACRPRYVIVVPFRLGTRSLSLAANTGTEVNVLSYSAFQMLKGRSRNSKWVLQPPSNSLSTVQL